MQWLIWFGIAVCALVFIVEGIYWLSAAYKEWRMVRITAALARRFEPTDARSEQLRRSAERLGKKDKAKQ